MTILSTIGKAEKASSQLSSLTKAAAEIETKPLMSEAQEIRQIHTQMTEAVGQKLDIPVLRKIKAQGDQRGLLDALRNVRDNTFDTTGGGVGGSPLIEEALGSPAWQHSGRQVKIVNMSPQQYLEKSAKGHGLSVEELIASLKNDGRTDKIVEGMTEGKQFQLPYLDYRNGFGQEGQHRALAAQQLGKQQIPVAVMWQKAADIADARQTKELKAFAEDFGSRVEKRAEEKRVAFQEARETGVFDNVPAGFKFMTPLSQKQGSAPWEVVGHSLDKKHGPMVHARKPDGETARMILSLLEGEGQIIPIGIRGSVKGATGVAATGATVAAVGTDQAEAGTSGVDWDFIAEKEGNELSGYVPSDRGGVALGTSGVTIGMGIDLGAWGEDELRKAGVQEALITKLKPYFGLKKQKAIAKLALDPITVTKAEAKNLNTSVKGKLLEKIEKQFNADSATDFDTLTDEQQTVIASVFFQYGTNKNKKGWPTNFWAEVTEGRWADAKKNLEAFGDAYKTRRRSEAAKL